MAKKETKIPPAQRAVFFDITLILQDLISWPRNPSMPDKIIINNLKLSCRVGVPDEERKKPQTIEVDLHLGKDLRPAGASDDVGKTVDYAAVAAAIAKHVQDKEYKLLERLADDLATDILNRFDVDTVQIQVRKRPLKEADWTGVEIVREKIGNQRKLGFSA
jgi:dihydroneopterin aldolase